MAKGIAADDAGAVTFLAVGFPVIMLNVPVADLSIGWRMRLTPAVSMREHADRVLFDEPTNHIDEQCAEWPCEWLSATSAHARSGGTSWRRSSPPPLPLGVRAPGHGIGQGLGVTSRKVRRGRGSKRSAGGAI